MEDRLRGSLFAAGSSLSYALYLVSSKHLLGGSSPFSLGIVAFGGASALLWLHVSLRGWREKLATVSSRLGHLIAIGLVGSTIQVSTLLGLKFSSPINAAIITRADIGIALLLGLLFLGEKPRGLDLPGALLMIGGALRTIGLGEVNLKLGAGDLLFALAALGLALNALLIKISLRWLDKFLVAAFNTGMMFLSSLLLALASGELGHFPHSPGMAALPLLFAASISAYYTSLSHLPIWLARAFTLLQPPLAALLAAVLLGEPLLARQAQGMGLLLVGGAMIVWGSKIGQTKREGGEAG